MPTVEGQLAVSASLRWKQERETTGFADTIQGPDTLDLNVAVDASVFKEVLATEFTLAAAGSQTIDLRSFTNLFGVTVTANSVRHLIITAVGANGQLKIIPGASNPINFWFGAATHYLLLHCPADGTTKCGLLLGDGTSQTVDATHRNVDVSNPGSGSITVRVAAFVGTP